MADAMTGTIVTGYLVAGLLFLRFWRDTRDRLFGSFAGAFGLLALQRALLFLYPEAAGEERTALYLLRLVAFLVILYAIVDKNRRPRVSVSASAPTGR